MKVVTGRRRSGDAGDARCDLRVIMDKGGEKQGQMVVRRRLGYLETCFYATCAFALRPPRTAGVFHKCRRPENAVVQAKVK